MRITAIEEYGLRCLLQLAQKGTGGQMSISEIAAREGLSISYTSKLLSTLRRAELVVAERGRGGGFSIIRNPSEITLYEVLTSLGGPLIDPQHCRRYTGQLDECVHIQDCSVYDVLGGLAGYIRQFLGDTTLDELIFRDRPTLLAQKATGNITSMRPGTPVGMTEKQRVQKTKNVQHQRN